MILGYGFAKQIFAKDDVNLGTVSPIFNEPKVNDSLSAIFRGEFKYQELQNCERKHCVHLNQLIHRRRINSHTSNAKKKKKKKIEKKETLRKVHLFGTFVS